MLSVLELFAGIGGCTAAVGARARIVAAIDTSELAMRVYETNWTHPTRVRNLAVRRLVLPEADLWWASPPCQPYTVRGAKRDLDDPRAQSLIVLMDRLRTVQPRYFAMENVPGFVDSRAHALVQDTLQDLGYEVWQTVLCPTVLGLPVERRRFYLVGGRDGLCGEPPRCGPRQPLQSFLDVAPDPALDVSTSLLERFGDALHVVDAADPHGVLACFTSAYGRSPVYAGSYLRDGDRLRHLSISEALRLLGFPTSFTMPPDVSLAQAWGLVGNSLSVHAVRHVLGVVPEFAAEPMGAG